MSESLSYVPVAAVATVTTPRKINSFQIFNRKIYDKWNSFASWSPPDPIDPSTKMRDAWTIFLFPVAGQFLLLAYLAFLSCSCIEIILKRIKKHLKRFLFGYEF